MRCVCGFGEFIIISNRWWHRKLPWIQTHLNQNIQKIIWAMQENDRSAFPGICLLAHLTCINSDCSCWMLNMRDAQPKIMSENEKYGEKEIEKQYIIEVLIFIYLSFVRLLLYNKHLIDVWTLCPCLFIYSHLLWSTFRERTFSQFKSSQWSVFHCTSSSDWCFLAHWLSLTSRKLCFSSSIETRIFFRSPTFEFT